MTITTGDCMTNTQTFSVGDYELQKRRENFMEATD
jgi:hypothetical protein